MEPSGIEQRRHPRYPVDWGVEIQIGDWHDAQLLTSGNLSEGGLFIRFANLGIERGMTLRVALRLPDRTRVEVEGVVAHVVTRRNRCGAQKVPGFGLRFTEKHAMELKEVASKAASQAGSAQRYHIEAYISLDAELRRGDREVGMRTRALAPRRPTDEVSKSVGCDEGGRRGSTLDEAPTLISTPGAPIEAPAGPVRATDHEYQLRDGMLEAALAGDAPIDEGQGQG